MKLWRSAENQTDLISEEMEAMEAMETDRVTENAERARLPLSAYLSYLLVATLLFTGVSFSKFASTASGSDSATVARVVINGTETTTANTITLDKPNGSTTASYSFSVSNAKNGTVSEVSLSYKIIVNLPDALPTGVTVNLVKSGSTAEHTATISNSNKTYTFSNSSFTFPAGSAATHSYTLNFVGGGSLVESKILNGITVSVTAEQIN